MRWAGNTELMSDMRNAWQNYFQKPEGKRQLGRARCTWEDNLKINLKETAWEDVNWFYLVQVSMVTLTNCRVLYKARCVRIACRLSASQGLCSNLLTYLFREHQ
jgi:hypothetical protein